MQLIKLFAFYNFVLTFTKINIKLQYLFKKL
jgi:hypothetical protein